MIQGLDEETLQELFQELKREDKRTAGSFVSTWQAATARAGDTRRRPHIIHLAVTTLAMIVICTSLLVYLRHALRQSTPLAISKHPLQVSGSQSEPYSFFIRPFGEAPENRIQGRPLYHPSVQSISQWRSPTAFLLRPPIDSLLTDLPDLKKSLIRIDIFKTGIVN